MSKVHDLPHGATIDVENQVVRLPVGEKIVLKFGMTDFQSFCEVVDDIKMIIDFYSTITTYECLKCGSMDVEVDYTPPDEEDEN